MGNIGNVNQKDANIAKPSESGKKTDEQTNECLALLAKNFPVLENLGKSYSEIIKVLQSIKNQIKLGDKVDDFITEGFLSVGNSIKYCIETIGNIFENNKTEDSQANKKPLDKDNQKPPLTPLDIENLPTLPTSIQFAILAGQPIKDNSKP